MPNATGYGNLDTLRRDLKDIGGSLPLSEDMGVLARPVQVGGHVAPNRLAIQPLEGGDALPDGSPGELTFRRYRRLAQGGAGMIWMEATAVSFDSRGNDRQLVITRDNLDAFKRLVEQTKEAGHRANGFEPLILLQATHSGRMSRPRPMIAYHHPLLEGEHPLPGDRLLDDGQLAAIEPLFGETARLCHLSGMEGVDIKACHRYLFNELLSAYHRPGPYGGSLENRSRLLRNSIEAARGATGGGFLVTARLNLYDGFPYPWGYGVKEGGDLEPDMAEPIALVELLHRGMGMEMINFSLNQPWEHPGGKIHPLEPLMRMFDCIGGVTRHFPELVSVSSGHSALGLLSPYLAAGAVEQGVSSIAGFGRLGFAYPDFPRDILGGRGMDSRQLCIGCGLCSMMLPREPAGCPVRDGAVYPVERV